MSLLQKESESIKPYFLADYSGLMQEKYIPKMRGNPDKQEN